MVLRPTIANLVLVTIMALVGIYATKALNRTYRVPGLADLVDGV